MSGKRSPQEMFPNLFGARSAPATPAAEMAPQDLRLVQYCMRQASRKKLSQIPAPPVPSRMASTAPPARPAVGGRPAARSAAPPPTARH